jgi:hypothetical protein
MPYIDRNIFILSERNRNFVNGNRTWNQDMKRNLISDDQQFQIIDKTNMAVLYFIFPWAWARLSDLKNNSSCPGI